MIGHNTSAEQLRSYVQRIERLIDERANVNEDIKSIYEEAKSAGFDVSTMRKVIKLKAMDAAKREEQKQLLETYMAELGLDSLPLFEGE